LLQLVSWAPFIPLVHITLCASIVDQQAYLCSNHVIT
jgi:hypothetical protein